MTKAEASAWIARARQDLRELQEAIRRPGPGWLEDDQALELANDAIGSIAEIQAAMERERPREFFSPG